MNELLTIIAYHRHERNNSKTTHSFKKADLELSLNYDVTTSCEVDSVETDEAKGSKDAGLTSPEG